MSAPIGNLRRPPVIGIAGGIGAGKTLVAQEFTDLGCLVISSDALNHEILRRPEVLATLRSWWGDRVIASGGEPDHKAIASIVFSSPPDRTKLESLTHPLIRKRRQDMILAVDLDSAVPAIILDSPLLFEARLDRECDAVVFIDASESNRLERVRQTRNWSLDELRRRENAQLPLNEKRSRADFVIANNGSVEDLRAGVRDILAKVVSRDISRR